MTTTPLAVSFGTFVAAHRGRDTPGRVRHEATRSLVNFLGCAIGAARAVPVDTAVRVLGQFAAAGEVTLLGRPERGDRMLACFVNALAANLLDFDDTHLPTVMHPTAPVAPVALALGEIRGAPGGEVLDALMLGMEVACRIGKAVSPGHYARGWHITATAGVFGAAACASRLLGLDAQRTVHALGIAASQSAGLVENLTTAAKNVGVGNAARNGLLAALLAEAGYEAALTAIEGKLGWARAMGDALDTETALADLGQLWEAAANTFKPYPCGIVFHPVIDACLALRRRGVVVEEVRGVVVQGAPLLIERGDRPVANERDARVSLPHSVAVALLFGRAGLREFEFEVVHAPAVVALRGRVRAEVDPSLPVGAARVIVETAQGTVTEVVLSADGSPTRPLTDETLEAKARALLENNPVADVDGLLRAAWTIADASDVRALLALARPAVCP